MDDCEVMTTRMADPAIHTAPLRWGRIDSIAFRTRRSSVIFVADLYESIYLAYRAGSVRLH